MVEAGAPAGGRAPRSTLRTRLRRGAIGVGAVLALLYFGLFFAVGKSNLLSAVTNIAPPLLALPVVATLLSYLTMSLSYEGIAKAAGAVIRSRDMLRITFIANTANYVLPSGGLTGFAVRLVFFTKRGVHAGRAVAISFTQTLLTNLMLVVFVVFGLINLLVTGSIGGASLVVAVALASVLTGLLLLSLLMIYRRSLRRKILDVASSVVDRVLARTRYHGRLAVRAQRLFDHVNDGMELFAERPSSMLAPSMWIFLDWLFMISTLYLCFYAVGYPVSFSQVTIAFSVSIIFAIMSFVPGGAAVLEGALAGVFALFGIAIKDSLVPIFLYRVSYFVFPAIISLLLAPGVFAEVDVDDSVAEDIL